MTPEIGGGYRRHPQRCNKMLNFISKYVDLGFPDYFSYRMIQNVGTYKQLWGRSGVHSLYPTKGLKSPPGSYFEHLSPMHAPERLALCC